MRTYLKKKKDVNIIICIHDLMKYGGVKRICEILKSPKQLKYGRSESMKLSKYQ